ncbi:MAG TPA: enolase C-terminal domain-like protein [Ramlibacter sp.]|uniref:enolase C-terminal domain-like protein n=1 Tax=Ramlibacter sp. TaxID=1917967 RepID=UPI002D7E76C3|nr:enolase C-terminal domain-like protein [Ramlibacter sp.]HET8747122.1 enolase C-terminal domain-like protein [Ramlibacter sp.]
MPEAASPAGLHLRSVRCTPVEVPLRYVLGTSAATVKAAPLLLVELLTEEGVTGRSYVFCYRRSGARPIAALVEDACEVVRGERVAPVAMAARLQRRFALIGVTGIARMALSAFDMALWDALAVAAGVPLTTLLGGAPRPVRAYNSCGLGLMSPQEAADEAEQLLEGGMQAVKLRLGYATLQEDLAVTRAVRARLPDSVEVMVDYNQALSRHEALLRGRALQSEGVSWLEEPIRQDDFAGCAAIARALHLPVQIGENFDGPKDLLRALQAEACDLVMPDVARIGGVTGWMQAAGVAEAHGIPMSSHLMPEVSAHLLAATPTCHWLEYVDWTDAIAAEPVKIVDGCWPVNGTPGSGHAWDAEKVARWRME